jgi:hypothetical protein
MIFQMTVSNKKLGRLDLFSMQMRVCVRVGVF